jgi:serine/threonine protein kinase
VAKVKLLDPSDPRRKLDRYELIGEIATGGMATVFLARRGGAGGFQRFVAIKRLHPHLQGEPEFVEMFLDEARLAALIHHPNVVPILEVGESEAGYYLVMEYVEGDTLSKIVARAMSLGQMPPRQVILRMMLDALAGLHAAHELRDERGQLLGLVHRDCSPQNVLIGVDGTARITDFGVARASSRLTSTAHGKLKGKLAYMAPEQTRGDELDRRTDLFAMGIILWEVLCGKRLFKADNEAATLQRILVEAIRPPSQVNADIPPSFDAVVLRALDRQPEKRYQTAADFADALEAAGREAAKLSVSDVGVASPREVASYVQQILGQEIGAQRESVRAWLAQSDSGQEVIITGAPRTPVPARDGSAPVAAVPRADAVPNLRYEVAADVTMRFALESKKEAALPSPAPPPPSSATKPAPLPPPPESQRAVPPPPRPPPPPKPSQPTLLGQGPPLRDGQVMSAPVPAAGRPVEKDPPATQKGLGVESEGFGGGDLDDDLGEDAVTVARRTDAPLSLNQPQVKTQRGLFATPEKAPVVTNAVQSTNLASLTHTPRMPMSPEQAGVPEAKVQIAKAALGAGVGSSPPGALKPGAIQEAVPIVEGLPAPRTPSTHPRTLVSAGGNEVSAGGFTPGSMTLPTPSSGLVPNGYSASDVSDPTLVHSLPKRPIGRYVVVLAAFLFVFAGGLLFLKYRDSSAKSVAQTAEPETAKPRTTATAQPVPTVPTLTSSASSTASTAPSAQETAEPVKTAEPETTGKPGKGPRTSKTAKPVETSTATTSKPAATATAKPSGENLTNPYR